MNSLSRLSFGLLAASLGIAEGATLLQTRTLAFGLDGGARPVSGGSAGLTVTAVLEKAGGLSAADEGAAQSGAVDPESPVHGAIAASGEPVFRDDPSGAEDPLTTLTLAQTALSAMMEETLSAASPTGTLDFFSLNPGATAETDARITVSSVVSAYVGSTTFLRSPDVFRLADATGPAGALQQALTMSDAIGVKRWRR